MAVRTTGVRYDLIGRDRASRTFNQVGGSASRLERGLGRLGKAAKVAGLALGVALGAGLAESAKKAVEFQAEMLRIQTQAGASASDVKTLSAQVLELGKSAEQGPQELSAALYHLKSVGMDNVAAMKALKVSSDLAAVGGSDLEATTNALAGAWRTGIRGATDMTTAAQTLNATIGAGNMTMEDMVAALGTGILPTAKTFGLTLSQVGSALALFTDEGVDSASAATRLRMSISLLGAPSRAAEKQLARIKLSGEKLGDAMRGPDGLIGAMELLKAHLDASGLSATQSASLLSHAFGGGKSSSAILSMLNNLDVLKQKQEQVNKSMGKYGPAVEAQRKTADAQIRIIRSNLEVFAIKTGNILLPPLTTFVTYLTTKVLPAVHNFGHELVTKLVPVDEIKRDFTTVKTDITDFIDGLKGPKAPTVKVNPKLAKMPQSALELGHADVTVRAHPKVVPPGSALSIGHADVKVKPVYDGSAMSLAHIPKLAPKEQKSQARQLGDQVRKLISGGIGDALKTAWKGIDWGKLGKQIGSGLGTAIGWVGQHLSDLTKKMIKALSKLDYVSIGKSFGKMAIPLAIGILTSLFDPLFSAEFWRKHWLDTLVAVVSVVPIGRVGGAVAKVFSKLPVLKFFAPFLERLGGLGKAVEKPLGKILKGVWAVAKGIGRGFIDGFERVFPEASRTLKTKLDDLVLKLFGYAASVGSAGLRIVEGLQKGIIRGAEGLGKIAGRVIGYLVKPFAESGGWLVKKGSAAVGGLRSGIAAGARRLGAWTTDHVIKPVTRPFVSAGSWLTARGSAAVSGLRSGITTGATKLKAWVTTNVVDKVTSAFSTAGTWLTTSGGALVRGLRSGITNAMVDIGKWLSKHLVKPVVDWVKSLFGIRSPSTVFASIGRQLIAGLLAGITARVAGIGKWLHAHVISPVTGAFSGASGWLVSRGRNLVSGLKNGVLDTAKGLGGWAKSHLANPIRNAFSGAGNWLYQHGIDLMTGLLSGIKRGFSSVASYLTDTVGSALKGVGSGLGGLLGFASGGMARIGTLAWVGENGPELMRVTPTGTRIYPHQASMAMAASGQLAGSGTVAAARVHPTGGGHVTYHYETRYEINARTADLSPADLDVLTRRAEARQRVGRAR